MGNPFSKAVDPKEEERLENEKMMKAREKLFGGNTSQSKIIKKEEVNQNNNNSNTTTKENPKIPIEEQPKKNEPIKKPLDEPKKPDTTTTKKQIINIDEDKEPNSKQYDLKKSISTFNQESQFSKDKQQSDDSSQLVKTQSMSSIDNKNDSLTEKKPINKENAAIEKIFKITLNPENDKFIYLEGYHAKLMSMYPDDETKYIFKLDDLDVILLEHIFHEETLKDDLIGYLLEVYHRAIELIEIR